MGKEDDEILARHLEVVRSRAPMMELEQMERVGLDVTLNIPIEKSKMPYTPQMIEYREEFTEWYKKLPPGTHVDFPYLG